MTLHIPSYQKFGLYPFFPFFVGISGCSFCIFVGEHTYGQNFVERRLMAIVYEITKSKDFKSVRMARYVGWKSY